MSLLSFRNDHAADPAKITVLFGAAIGLAIGSVGLIGWALPGVSIETFGLTGPTMKANTALCLVLLAGSLLLGNSAREPHRNRLGGAASTFAAVIGLATLTEDVFGRDFRIDEILFPDPVRSPRPGRMAPNTAFSVFVLGASLALSWTRSRRRRWTEWLSLAAGVIALVALVGHVYGAESFVGIGKFVAMAAPTAIALFALAVGTMILRDDYRTRRMLLSEGPGGMLARRLVPAIVLLAVGLGWLRLQLQVRLALVDTREGVALLVTSFLLCFLLLIWGTSHRLDVSAATLRRGYAELEDRIRDRTSELRRTNSELESLIEHAPDSIVMVESTGTIRLINAQTERLFGYARDELVGRPIESLIPLRFRERHSGFRHEFGRDPRFRPMGAGLDLFGLTKTGVEIPVEISLGPVHTAQGTFIQATIRDVTERKRAEQRIAAQERRFRTLFEKGQGLMCLHDPDGRLLMVNPAAASALGYEASDLVGHSLAEILDRNAGEQLSTYLEEIRSRGFASGQMNVLTRSRELRVWTFHNTTEIDADGHRYVIGNAMDVTDQARLRKNLAMANEALSDLATTDPLTGLPNRRLLEDRLGVALGTAQRDGHRLGIVYLDLDHFKSINDSLGHPIGDRILQEATRRISAMIRASDTLARVGGDEFVLLLPKMDRPEAAQVVARKIGELFQTPIEIDGREIPVSMSVGTSCFPEDGEDAAALIGKADAAMYASRRI